MSKNQNQSFIVESLRRLDTACVSDAMDRLGIKGGLQDIKPLGPGLSLCGQAFTIRYKPCDEVKGTVGDFLDDVEPGRIVIIDNEGRVDCTVWGGLMSLAASKRGIGGTVINGACRDVHEIRAIGYPLFSKGFFMMTGKDRVRLDAVNVKLTISGVEIYPHDFLLGDDSGVVVIPQERALDVLNIAKEIAEKEDTIANSIRKGVSLREARAQSGYHKLQSQAEKQ